LSGLLIALAARNTQLALCPTSPVDKAYARFSSCQSAAPLARPDRRISLLIDQFGRSLQTEILTISSIFHISSQIEGLPIRKCTKMQSNVQ
jgi:hypothetical protein